MSLVGLAMKAGKLVSGETGVEQVIRARKAKLLLLAVDASLATKKSYYDLAKYYSVPVIEKLTKEELGKSIGKIQRAAAVITDDGFAAAIKNIGTS